MRNKRGLLSVAVVALVILLGFSSSIQAKGKKQTNTLVGYCCLKGSVDTLSEKLCEKKGGDFFSKKTDALKQCKKTQSQANSISSSKNNQSKLKDVYCCTEGKVDKMSSRKCSDQDGEAYTTLFRARSKCKPEEVYICTDGEVDRIYLEDLKGKNVKTYKSRGEAGRSCGWYCDDGRVFSSDSKLLDSRNVRRLKLYSSKENAQKECRKNERGFCCTPMGVVPSAETRCKKPASFFSSRTAAIRKCRENEISDKRKTPKEGEIEISEEARRRLFGPGSRVPGGVQLPPRHMERSALREGTLLHLAKGEEHGIRVISPARGEHFTPGSTIAIRYDALDLDRPAPANVNVVLRDATLGAVRHVLLSGTLEENRDYTVELPQAVPEGDGYTVTVASLVEPDGGESRWGISDPFSIFSPVTAGGESCDHCVRFLNPANGARWLEGSMQEVSWQYSGSSMPEEWEVRLNAASGYRLGSVERYRRGDVCSSATNICTVRYPVPLNIGNRHIPDLESAFTLSLRSVSDAGSSLSARNRDIVVYREGLYRLPIEVEVSGESGSGTPLISGMMFIHIRNPNRQPGSVNVYLLHNGTRIATVRENYYDPEGAGERLSVSDRLVPGRQYNRLLALLGGSAMRGFRIQVQEVSRPSFIGVSPEFTIAFPELEISAMEGVLSCNSVQRINWVKIGFTGRLALDLITASGRFVRNIHTFPEADSGAVYEWRVFSCNDEASLSDRGRYNTNLRFRISAPDYRGISAESGIFQVARSFVDYNRESCEQWCNDHWYCVGCSRLRDCGRGYERLQRWTGRGVENWSACGVRGRGAHGRTENPPE